jgi:putative transposase
MITFVDKHRASYGVESICRVLPIAPSTYYHQLACRADPTKLSPRCQRDVSLKPKIQKVWDDNWKVYGVRKTWRQLRREGVDVARCTVARLMADMGLRGVVRGRSLKATISDTSVSCPRDKVNRQFRASAPNTLWVSDSTYVSTWQRFTYVAFIIDTFANCIVGWKVSRSAKTDFVLDALEQALYARRLDRNNKLTHHSDRGSQYVSIRYTERLAESGIEPSVGSVGGAYNNALAETINGLHKTEVIRRRNSWKTMEEAEMETLKWVDWFNHRRLHEPIGNIPPAEAEENYYAIMDNTKMAA